jgi:hypothetical protein
VVYVALIGWSQRAERRSSGPQPFDRSLGMVVSDSVGLHGAISPLA